MEWGINSEMPSWFFSLQFRLIVGFTLVLALALGGVSAYASYAAQQEIERFEGQIDDARGSRLRDLVAGFYANSHEWSEIQPALEQAGSLYDWRIVVTDQQGIIVGDSHRRFGRPYPSGQPGGRRFPIISDEFEVGALEFRPPNVASIAPEPPFSRLVSAVNQSLLFTGLTAAAGGILLVSLISRRVLTPVRSLSVAAGRLGQGDLSQRVAPSGVGEIGQLSTTFNSMAANLEQAEQQRRNLVADVAHELRTPLSNIQGYLEAVKDGLLQPDEETIDTLLQQVSHLSHLVEDLRVLAMAEAGVLQLNRGPDAIQDILRRSTDAFRPRAEARGVSVDLDLPETLPLVDIDRTRIGQVLTNLMENALAHTPDSGSITISAEEASRSTVRVTIADSGEGIPSDDLPHIFDRFYRVDPSRTRATGGAGIGLTIVKQLIELHGGTVRAESFAGEGSRFIFELPVADVGGASS